ncbi:MAG: hypothetical protein AB8C95_16065 [Phycisphaeraceae bacterium]
MTTSFSVFPAIIVVVILLFLVIAIVLVSRSSKKAVQTPSVPGCGGCGYPTRGIAELKCPECGADLTKVGIIKPGDGGVVLAGCLLPLLLTITMFLLAVLGYNFADLVVPTYRQQSLSLDFKPDSDQYHVITFEVDATLIIPPGTSSANFSSGIATSNTYGPPSVTTITLNGFGANTHTKAISLQAMPTPPASTISVVIYAPPFVVDPASAKATWTDAKGKTQTSQGPFADHDVLAYLGSAGADTTKQDVIDEAQQLHAMIDGLLNGGNAFSLIGLDSRGSGSGASQQLGPTWFLPAYAIAWVVLWIIVMIFLGRRARKAR